MKLNPVELVLVNNLLRDLLLRSTVGWLWSAACGPSVGRVLEIGCGQGDGVREIVRPFRPRAVDAFDLDEAQVERARARLAAPSAPSCGSGSATRSASTRPTRAMTPCSS